MFKRNDPATGEPRNIEVAMGMTIKDLIEKNRLETGLRVAQGYTVDVDKLTDVMPIFFDDNWIKFHLLAGEQSFELPPGRTLQISQRAGHVIGISFRPFAQPRPLDEMRAYAKELISLLEKKGWQPTGSSRIPVSQDDFDASGKSLFGAMKASSGSEIMMTLRDYGLGPKHESFLLLPDPNFKMAERSHTYLLEVDVYDGVRDYYENLVYPRRIFETGDPTKALPLRQWIEYPDWTPEKAGMVPTTAKERTMPDASNWKMSPNHP
ncbi:hypothetical protein [Allorhizobium taibaishanense]|nr:hypothetical protein [Allorhizobium taibaishanense]MBB4010688.1 hypothetical protein [Allorhizobium taibaishanense]